MNLIVFTVRGLRSDALGAYGNSWIETPAFDQLASQGVVFDRHYADGADITTACRAWRSGIYHFRDAKNTNIDGRTLPDLLAQLRQQDIKTCLIVDTSHAYPAEFASGWDETLEVDADGEDSPLESALKRAHAFLKKGKNRDSWLLWIDVATLLPPWNVPEEFQKNYFREDKPAEPEQEVEEADPYDPIEAVDDNDEEQSEALEPLPNPPLGPVDSTDDTLFLRLQNSYAAAVTYLDAGVGELLEAIEKLGLAQKTAILLTSDAGFALGEHGTVGPEPPSLHAEVIHLPLIIRLPEPALVQRVSVLTQSVDLAPTIAAFFEQSLAECDGLSLLPLLYGDKKPTRARVIASVTIGEIRHWALRTAEWAYLITDAADEASRSVQLYVKPDDRWEVNNVVHHHMDVAEQLERDLRGGIQG